MTKSSKSRSQRGKNATRKVADPPSLVAQDHENPSTRASRVIIIVSATLAVIAVIAGLVVYSAKGNLLLAVAFASAVCVGAALAKIPPQIVTHSTEMRTRPGSAKVEPRGGSVARAWRERAIGCGVFVGGVSGLSGFVAALGAIIFSGFRDASSMNSAAGVWSVWGLIGGGVVSMAYWGIQLARIDVWLSRNGGWATVERLWDSGHSPFSVAVSSTQLSGLSGGADHRARR